MKNSYYKIVVFVPVVNANDIRKALSSAGAGHIGNYDFCSFSSKGIGRFRPGKNSNPHIGSQGQIEEVEEERIETICPKDKIEEVLESLKKVHPYEEPAIDVFELCNI